MLEKRQKEHEFKASLDNTARNSSLLKQSKTANTWIPSMTPMYSLSLHSLQVRFETSSWSGHTHLVACSSYCRRKGKTPGWWPVSLLQSRYQISGCRIKGIWWLQVQWYLSRYAPSPEFLGIPSPPPQECGTAWFSVFCNKTFSFLWDLQEGKLPNTHNQICGPELSS